MHKLKATKEYTYRTYYGNRIKSAQRYICTCGLVFQDVAMGYYEAKKHIGEKNWPKPKPTAEQADADRKLRQTMGGML